MFRINIKKRVLYSKTYQSAKSETKGEDYRLEETLNDKLIFVSNRCCSICMLLSHLGFLPTKFLNSIAIFSAFSVF